MSIIFSKRGILLFIICLFFIAKTSFAEELSIREEINQLKARITELEEKLATQEKTMCDQKQCIIEQDKKIADYEAKLNKFDMALHRQVGEPITIAEGLEIGAGATLIVQGTNNANYNNPDSGVETKHSRTDGSYSTDITLAKEFNSVGGRAFLHLENGQSQGIEDSLILYSNVNRDTDDDVNVRVTEIWYEQEFFKDKAVVTFGKLDPTAYFDNNELANDETTQFLGRIFRNTPTIDFPDNTLGIRLAFLPKEWIELGYGIFNANGSWKKINNSLFNIGQIIFKTNFWNRAGNYRFYGWNNNAHYTKWLDSAKTKEYAYGFGLSFDQKLSDAVSAFCRYGWQDPSIYSPDISTIAGGLNYSLEQSWSAGLQFEGKLWGREDDVLGFAVGQVFPSQYYKKSDSSLRAKPEGHLETYYKIFVNKHLSLSPDFQYIWNPFGKDVARDTDSIFVGGVRAQIDF